MENTQFTDGTAGNRPTRVLRPVAKKAGLLVAALMLSTSLSGVIAPTIATAQSPTAERTFAIPAQRLSTALIEFSNVSGIDIFFNQNAIGNRSTDGLTGRYTTQSGLAQLLSGTGLTYSFNDANSVTVSDRVAEAHTPLADDGSLVLDVIDVTGGGAGNPADAPYETAGSSNYISQADLERFGTTTTGNMFRGTPGVLNRDNNNSHSLDVNVRGMQGMNRVPIKVDGSLQSMGNYRGYLGVDTRSYIDPAFIGGMAITKEPDGGVNGSGATGGVVNMRTINAGDIIKGDKDWGVRLRGGVFSNTVSPPSVLTQEKRTDAPSIFDLNSGQGSIVGAYRTDNFEIVGGFARTSKGNDFAGTNGRTTIREEKLPGQFVEEPISKVPPGSEILNSQRYTSSALLKAKGTFGDGHELGLTYIYYDSKFGEVMPSEVTRTKWDDVRQWAPNEATSHRLIGHYGWNPAENDLVDIKLNTWVTWLDSLNRGATTLDQSWWDNPYQRMPAQTSMYGFDLSNTSRFTSGFGELDVTVGGSYSYEDTEPEDKDPQNWTPPNGTRSEASAFVQASLQATDWLRFDGGLRYTAFQTRDRSELLERYYEWYGVEHEKLDGSAISPNISVTVEPFDGVQFFAKYAEGFRGPSMIEATANFNRVPNPNLKAEEAKNWEFGVNVLRDNFLTEGDKLRFKAVHFRNNIDNYIGRAHRRIDDGVPTLNRSYNMGAAKFEGFEAAVDYDGGKWFTNLSATYYSKVAFCGTFRMEYIPEGSYFEPIFDEGCVERAVNADYSMNSMPPRYSASATLGFRLFEDKLTIGSRLTYVGARASRGARYEEDGGLMPVVKWRPYTLIDAFASYKINDTVTIDFSGENLTNEYYIDALSLAATPAPGRTFRLNLTAQF